MTSEISFRPGSLPVLLLGMGLLAVPVGLHAQTLDSGSGLVASQKLSTPPDTAPINQPGAMQRAYAHPAKPDTQPAHETPKPRPSTPPR